MILDVLDYPDPATAFADAREGDTVYLPGVRAYEAPPGGWEITKSLVIRGDGPGKAGTYTGTVLTPSSQAPPPGGGNEVLVIKPPAGQPVPNVTIRDLRITRRQGQSGHDGRHGILLAEGATRKISQLRLERIAISHMGGAGIHLVGTDADNNAIVGSYILDCDVSSCALQGMRLEYAFQTFVVRSRFASNGKEGVWARDSEIVLQACTLDGNRTLEDPQDLCRADLVIEQCSLARVDACKFKNFGTGTKRACYMDDVGGVAIVGACVFELVEVVEGSVGLEFASVGGPGYGAVAVLPNRFSNVETAVRVADLVAGCTVLQQASDPAGAAIVLPSAGEDAPTAVPSLSTPGANQASGLLLPMLLSNPDQALARFNVQAGMLVYINQANPALRVFVAGAWADVATQ